MTETWQNGSDSLSQLEPKIFDPNKKWVDP